MMASNTATQSPFERSLAQLQQAGHGAASFEINAAGELVHAGTVVTVKMQTGEKLLAFHHRLRRDFGLQAGDRIELLNNNGKCDTARLHLQPR